MLGLGIGTARSVERYDKPLATMRTYRDRMGSDRLVDAVVP